MALTQTPPDAEGGSGPGPTVIAIDGSRNSQYAVKWAVDHLLRKNSSCILIHVRTKSMHPHDFDDTMKHGRPPTEEEMHQFFLPFRGFCARKGITARELVLHDIDVPSALTDYVIDNFISNIVVGASQRNAFIRKFKDEDVPTSLVKSLPESCTLHVVSKEKVQNIRPKGHPQNINITTTRSIRDIVTLLGMSSLVHSHDPDSGKINRNTFKHGDGPGSSKGWVSFGRNKDAVQVKPSKSNGDTNSPRLSAESSSSQNSSNHSSTSDSSRMLGSQWNDMSHGNQELDITSDSSRNISSSTTPMSLEIAIRKLKLELMKTTEQFTMACREAVASKQMAMELEKFRQEKERNIEQARVAEEAALALVEVERHKTKAAMESAEMSQCLAEMETQKRKQAEVRAMHEEEEKNRALNAIARNSIPYRRYNIKEIEVATHYFDNTLKIGEGGYGPVFKGVLDHTAVAIKVLRPDIAHGERQFQQEVDVLSNIRHPNMVLLLGACPEFGCLVYEYMEGGSLEDRLFQKNNTPPIPWKVRFKIASEIATCLLFLHQTKPEPLVHRDLKPANILLDRNYVSKIGDVGLARLVPPSVADKTTQYHMTAAAGTFCYIDPEYQQTGQLGVKSDIYSLGVMLLQIITAKLPMGLSHMVEKAIHKGKFLEVLDPSVTDWPVEEVLSYAKLAIKCCELRKRDRPDLGKVILPELNRLKDLGQATDTDILPKDRKA